MTPAYEEEFQTRSNPDLDCAATATTQYGLISRDQALDFGMSKNSISRRVTSGRWERIFPGVYRVGGVPPSWLQEIRGACLWAGPEAVAARRAAAAIWEFPDFEEEPLEIASTKPKTNKLVIVHQVKTFGIADRADHKGIPLTSPARTIVDLAGDTPRLQLRLAIDYGDRCGLFTFARLRWQVRQSSGTRGVRELGEWLEGTDVPDTVFERMLLELIREGGLPLPQLQYPIYEDRKFIARPDFVYPEARLVIEADSLKYHLGKVPFYKDRQRMRALASRGWRILPVTWRDLCQRPQQVLQDIRRALGLS